ncbi:unnamed protein product [Discosporangium mesarthrocarpum]
MPRRPLNAVGTGLLALLVSLAQADWRHSSYPLALLDGSDGFKLNAEASVGQLGYSVSRAGDINNDGYDDVIIGEAPSSTVSAGAAYVVFGAASFSLSELDVASLDGTNGFKIAGTDNGDFAGAAVSGVGDVNSDGFADVMVGAWGASSAAGEIMVVFGGASFGPVVSSSDLDGSTGFVVTGSTSADGAGFSIAAAGDVNKDGADDILIGAHKADPAGSMSGEAYVVFGAIDWSVASVDLGSLGSAGLTFQGGDRRYYSGFSVSGAGDINDDGTADIVIAAYGVGEAYVFYGAESFSASTFQLSAISSADGIIISVGEDGDTFSVAGAGDVNNDGFDDIAIGYQLADPGISSEGSTYVLLGGLSLASPLSVASLDGTNGFFLHGQYSGDRSGTSVSSAGVSAIAHGCPSRALEPSETTSRPSWGGSLQRSSSLAKKKIY